MCAKAKQPLRKDFIEKLGLSARTDVHCGAVCVYPNRVPDCVDALKGSGVGLASVAAGFPAGQTPMPIRIEEIKQAVAAGATEIDIVISREHVIAQNWQALYDETKAMRAACGAARLKCILAVGELPSMRDVYKASIITMMAGADFIKTSTGKISPAATLPVTLVMLEAIREHFLATGVRVGMKPAGGIRDAKLALHYLVVLAETLGEDWLTKDLFRFGASALVNDLVRQIVRREDGFYQSPRRFSVD